MSTAYGEDLAYTHDTGFGDFARNAAPALLAALSRVRENAPTRRLPVIDLGCGSGIWAEILVKAGYDVLGFDISEAMIALAKKRVPQGRFHAQSFLTAELPSCGGVTAIGECLSYLFDSNNTDESLLGLFRRIYD